VRSPDGEPLGLVWVQELGAPAGNLTKPDGIFILKPGKAAAVLFEKAGFVPEIRLITPSEEKELEVTLRLTPEIPTLESCKQMSAGPIRELRAAKSRSLQIRDFRDVDFVGYSATYSAQGSTAQLSSVTGIFNPGLTPPPDWVSGLSSFTVRGIRCGGEQWVDLRGESAEGLKSRWVGYPLSHVAYSKVSAQAARALDAAIDNGCCR
jgi:hypothetical protein